jgi:cation transport regulator ChaB
MKTPIDFIIEKMSRHDWAELPKSMKQEVISQAQELFENHIIEAYSSGYTDCSN